VNLKELRKLAEDGLTKPSVAPEIKPKKAEIPKGSTPVVSSEPKIDTETKPEKPAPEMPAPSGIKGPKKQVPLI